MVAAVLAAGSEKAAAHRLGLSHSTVKHHLANARSKVGAATTAQLVWILAPRLPEPEGAMPPATPGQAGGPSPRPRSRSGAARMSISAMRSPRTVKPSTANGALPANTTSPGLPLTVA